MTILSVYIFIFYHIILYKRQEQIIDIAKVSYFELTSCFVMKKNYFEYPLENLFINTCQASEVSEEKK